MASEFLAALGIIALVIIIGFLKRGNLNEGPPSRWDCAELDQDHVLGSDGRCTTCGKNFRKENKRQ